MGLREAIARRLLWGVLVALGVSFIVFLIQHVMPGDPVHMMLVQHRIGAHPAGEVYFDEQLYQEMRTRLGLDKPFHVQYTTFLSKALRGDLGYSFRARRTVISLINDNLPHTIRLAVLSLAAAALLGITAGVIAAIFRDRWIDVGVMVAAVSGVSMPSFWLAIVFIWVFGIILRWFPFIGVGSWQHEVLPVATLGLGGAGVIARLTRSSLVEVLGEDYIRTARAKGLPNRGVVFKHALRNAMLPVVTVIGLQFGALLGGTVIVETVFGRPGIGSLAVTAIMDKDFPVTQGVVLLAAIAFVMSNLIVDIAYVWLDPRIVYD